MSHSTFRLTLLAAALAGVTLAPAHAQDTVAKTKSVRTIVSPKAGSGIDRSGMDKSVRPQDDLYLAMNGAWVKDTQIPADKAIWGAFVELRELSDKRVREIAEGLASTQPAPGSNAQKVDDYYRAFLDEAAIDKAGLAPVEASLKDLDSVKDPDMLVGLIGH